jgi:hypothetical protein
MGQGGAHSTYHLGRFGARNTGGAEQPKKQQLLYEFTLDHRTHFLTEGLDGFSAGGALSTGDCSQCTSEEHFYMFHKIALENVLLKFSFSFNHAYTALRPRCIRS